jgi:hypothetical protein
MINGSETLFTDDNVRDLVLLSDELKSAVLSTASAEWPSAHPPAAIRRPLSGIKDTIGCL